MVITTSEMCELLSNATSEDGLEEKLKGFTVKELKQISRSLDVFCMQSRKSEIISSLIASTVGAKLRSEAIRKCNLRR